MGFVQDKVFSALKNGANTQDEIAKITGLEKPNIKHAIRKLVNWNLVSRQRNGRKITYTVKK